MNMTGAACKLSYSVFLIIFFTFTKPLFLIVYLTNQYRLKITVKPSLEPILLNLLQVWLQLFAAKILNASWTISKAKFIIL